MSMKRDKVITTMLRLILQINRNFSRNSRFLFSRRRGTETTEFSDRANTFLS